MSIDANLLYGLELGFGCGLVIGVILGAFLIFFVSRQVTLPW